MSIEALNWAFQETCPSSSTKLVLLAYANFANERGWAYPSTETIVRMSGLNTKTARAAIDALEQVGLLVDTGRRTGVTKQIKVYQLALPSLPKSDPFPGAPAKPAANDPDEAISAPRKASRPKTGALAKAPEIARKAPNSGRQNRQEPTPPKDADASSAPQGAEQRRSSRIVADWTPPPIADLPPQARAVAAQWPVGAYEAEAEAFRSYWLGEARAGARKVDWVHTWCNQILRLGSKPLRDAKAGITFARPAGSGGELTAEQRAASHESVAATMERLGRHDEAAEQRRHAVKARGG